MTPKQYLDRYTYLAFFSPINFMPVFAPITGYGSGWDHRGKDHTLASQCQHECQLFRYALRVAHHGNSKAHCPEKMFFDKSPLGLISKTEDFYLSSFIRAYCGKGSPDEIIDTLRLATAIGRIGTDRDLAGNHPAAPTASAYATKYMTLDCNGLVGNYFGENPSSDISHFASHARRRKSGYEVQVGDAVVTHCSEAPYEHIALIQEWNFDGTNANVRLVEWGRSGGEDHHYSTVPKKYHIKQGKDSKYGIGWESNSHRKANLKSFRYIFSPSNDGPPNGWF